jgi:hypothetical protein
MTENGGTNRYGVIFSVLTNGSAYNVLHNFDDTDGAYPYGDLTLSGSTLYGMSNQDGLGYLGNILSLDTNGSNYMVIHNFNGLGGELPFSSLTLSNNVLYGMTYYGGYDSCLKCSYGVIFKDSLISVEVDGINELKTKSEALTVFPNPFTNSTTISVESVKYKGESCLELYDITGQKLKQSEFTGNEYTLSVEGLAKGMYFIKVFDKNNNVIGTTKIVVQ